MKTKLLVLFMLAAVCAAHAGTTVDGSGTITVGGTSQNCVPATGNGKPKTFLMIQNLEATDHLHVQFTSAATTTTGIDLAPGAVIWMDVFVTDEAVNIVGPTTGDKFTCKYR